MNKFFALALALTATAVISPSANATMVHGYTKKDGTYVAPHHSNTSHIHKSRYTKSSGKKLKSS